MQLNNAKRHVTHLKNVIEILKYNIFINKASAQKN